MATQHPATIKQINILYYALFMGQAFIAVVIFYLMQGQEAQSPEMPYNVLIPGIVVIGIALTYYLGQQKKSSIPLNCSIQEKLDHYRESSVLKWALAEGANLISLVFTFLFANTNYLIWFGIGLAAFTLLRPSKAKFLEDYEIKSGADLE